MSAVSARAGDTVLYAPAAAWVKSADFQTALSEKVPLVLLDQQARLENGVTSRYSDVAYRIEMPEALTQAGTLQLGWMPDKGDLTIHRLEIYRDGKVIDLLAAGTKYTVLRRETQLEKRSIDGALTATLAVPGLKVGDVLRFSQTITTRDQALGGAMEFMAPLPAQPLKAGLARLLVSWPKDAKMAWRAGPDVDTAKLGEDAGYRTLSVALPLDKRPEQAGEAPARFTLNPLAQVASFADWQDVSRRMAPHFSTEGTITPGSALAKQVAAIAARSTDPRVRAAAALRTVQDDIGYLANGMDGGNYIPQKPEETWQKRFGDCKAKTMLLVAMLREMGIDAEPVLVRSSNGDAVSALLPMPGDFDHMIAHAVIGGRDYWLDGTNVGTRIDTMEEVPPFYYALPMRPGGAELMKMTQRWPSARDRVLAITYDYRSGLDMPVLYDATVTMRGQMGAAVRAHAEEKDPQARLDYAAGVMKDMLGDSLVYQTSIAYDADSGVGTVTAKGVVDSGFEYERGKGKLALNLPSTGFTFAPDRARAAWKDIPYAVGGPFGVTTDETVLLPEEASKLTLAGMGDYDGEVAGVKIHRAATLTADKLHIVDDAAKIPAEIAVADFAAQRAAVARLNGGDPVLRTGENPLRYWDADPATARKRIARLEPAYAAMIAIEPKDAWRWSTRAKLLQMGPDLKRAMADFDKAIALEPSAQAYTDRSSLRREMGDLPGALADAREAYKLEATVDYAKAVADILTQQGKADEALALLEPFDLSGDDRIKLMLARADIMGEGGRAEEGWKLLADAESERPGDASVLNAECWFMGNWSYHLDSAADVCDRAVKAGSYNSGVLDSRALVNYRLGSRDAARADLQAALTSEPGQTTSLYLRGIMALEDGQKVDGARDIAAATRLYGGIGAYFARFGVQPPK